MGRPKDGYRLKDGTKVPGVSTIAKVAQDSGGLIFWAWQQGQAGLDYRETRAAAAGAGTMAHDAVEAWIRQQPYVFTGDPIMVHRAQVAFDAFRRWADQTHLTVTHTEVSMVSEVHRVGGTLDAVLVNNQRALGDWKTASGVYPEALIQLAGYGVLWTEAYPAEPLDGGFHLIRFDREYGDFHAHWWSELKAAQDAFVHCRALYDLRATLKKRCG